MDTIINEKVDRSGCKILQDFGWSKIDGNVFQSKPKKIQQTNDYNKRGGDRGYQLGGNIRVGGGRYKLLGMKTG